MSNGDTLTPDQFMQQRGSSAPPVSTSLTPGQFMQHKTEGQSKSSLWEKANTPLISGKQILKGVDVASGVVPGAGDKATERAIAEGKPVSAAINAFASGTGKSIADLASSFTSPVSLAMLALSGGETALAKSAPGLAKLLRIPQLAAMLGFGAQGVEQAATPRKAGEDLPSELEQRLMGAGTASLSAAGTLAAGKDAIRNALRKRAGLNDDLASKVSEKIAAKQEAERIASQKTSAVEEKASASKRAISSKNAQTVALLTQSLQDQLDALQGQTASRISGALSQEAATKNIASSQLPELEKQKLQAGGRILADTAQYLHQEKAVFNQRFDEIGGKITSPVAEQGEIASSIKQAFKDKGIPESEIPSTAFKTVPEDASPRPSGRMTQSELTASQFANRMIQKGMNESDVRSAMINLGYAPKQVDAIIGTAKGVSGEGTGAVRFNQLTRIKNHLYDAGASASDSRVAAAFYDASARISDLQEKAAQSAGLGKQYIAVKNDYSRFMRGINSDMVHKLLSSYDAEDQNMSSKIAQMTTGKSADALRSVLRSAGIDTSPLDDVVSRIGAVEQSFKEAPKVSKRDVSEAVRTGSATESKIRRESAERISESKRVATRETTAVRTDEEAQKREIAQEADKAIKEAEAPGKIVPGKSSSELAGIPNQDLLRMRLREQADKLRAQGMHNPWAYFNILYGLMQLGMGSAWGIMHLGRGAAMTELPKILADPKFQEWALRQSGVEPNNKLMILRATKGLKSVYPVIRSMSKSGVPQAALSSDGYTTDGKTMVPDGFAGAAAAGETERNKKLPAGMVKEGNIDVNHRPVIWNDDGTPSTIFSATIYDDKLGKWVLIPTIANGKFLTPSGKIPKESDKAAMHKLVQAATDQYKKSGQYLGMFNTEKAADDYADRTHAWMPDGSDTKVYLPSYKGESNMPLTRKEYEAVLKNRTTREKAAK